MTNCWYLHGIVFPCFLSKNFGIFPLTRILIKILPRNFFGLRVKSLDNSAKNSCFSGFYNDSRNMFNIINKGKLFSYFPWNVSKTCQDGLKISQNIKIYLIHFKTIFSWTRNISNKLSIINCMQLFSIFSIFLFLLILFKFARSWIAIYLIGHIGCVSNLAFDYVEIAISKERKKICNW